MKALTLTQPWATLVASGAKRIETRSWRTNYTGPLAIHAAKGFPAECRDLCHHDPFLPSLVHAGFRSTAELPRGVIVAVAQLVRCVAIDDITPSPDELARLGGAPHEWAFGDYSPGRHAWLLHDVRALQPQPQVRGALGLWDVPDEIARLIDLSRAA